jgi:hypothetical protein
LDLFLAGEFQKQLARFPQVFGGFLGGISLTDHVQLGAQGYEVVFLSMNDPGEPHADPPCRRLAGAPPASADIAVVAAGAAAVRAGC